MANITVKSQTSTSSMVIKPISKLTTALSPEVIIHGIPWKVKVFKSEKKNSLSVYLHCAKKDNTSTWSAPACATIKLTTYDNEKNVVSITLHRMILMRQFYRLVTARLFDGTSC